MHFIFLTSFPNAQSRQSIRFFLHTDKKKIKGTATRFFALGVFHESFCPVPLIITLEQLRLFSKIWEMLAAQGKWKKFSNTGFKYLAEALLGSKTYI
jgi:hypothetical protein